MCVVSGRPVGPICALGGQLCRPVMCYLVDLVSPSSARRTDSWTFQESRSRGYTVGITTNLEEP